MKSSAMLDNLFKEYHENPHRPKRSEWLWSEFVRRTLDEMRREQFVQEYLKGLTVEQRLAGLSPQQMIQALSPDVLEALVALIRQRQANRSREMSHGTDLAQRQRLLQTDDPILPGKRTPRRTPIDCLAR